MAADQQRKRLNGATIFSCKSREQRKSKKKNLGLHKADSNINSHISLEWDRSQKMVLAKRDQIGINWRDMRPYLDSISNSRLDYPADVFVVPHGIYELKNLEDVLSYEVWQTNLSDTERSHLMQFLPRGPAAEQTVQALLEGDDFHFGNPLFKWGASLCSGNFHPDVILLREQSLMTDKKVYFKELQNYHNDVIAYLLELKEACASCEDPEKELLQKLWRSRNDMEKQRSSHANESRICDPDENAILTSESDSWVADEKACSSDNQISSLIRGRERQSRICEEGFLKDKHRRKLLAHDDAPNVGATPKKGDKLHKRSNISNNDGGKYMSYVKITKKQYEVVKSMKQSGRSIHFRSLNRVLGNDFNVQPYQVFVQEEQKKLHEHWFELVRKDLPVAYAIRMDMRLQRRKTTEYLKMDLKERLNFVMEQAEGNEIHSAVKYEFEIDNHEPTMQDDEKSLPDSPEGEACQPFHIEEDEDDSHACNLTDLGSEKHTSTQSDNDLEKDIIIDLDHSPPNASDYVGNLNVANADVSQDTDLCINGDSWKAVSMPHSYYDPTASHEYASVSELSVTLPQINAEHQTQMMDLDSEFPVGNIGKDLLHRKLDNGSFSPYPNQDQNEMLQSLFKGQGMLSYPLQKQTALDFRPANNVFMSDGQFQVHFEEQPHQSLPLELGRKRENDVYMPQNISESIYPDGGRFLIPRQEHVAPVNMHDWSGNCVRMPGSPQSHLNGGDMLSQNHLNGGDMLGQNWFTGENPVHGGWSGSGSASVTSHSIGSGNTADQSLYSVLSQCNQLRSGSPYHPMVSTDQFISPRNYGMVGPPRIGNVLPQAAHALDYMGGREAATSVMHDNVQWASLPHQNSGLRDPMGKPFLRSWNQ